MAAYWPGRSSTSWRAQSQRRFANQATWQAHLDRLGISALQVTLDPVQIVTKGALWGSVHAHGLLRDTIVVSHDAVQVITGLKTALSVTPPGRLESGARDPTVGSIRRHYSVG